MNHRRALLSVSDKTGIELLGKELVARGWEVLSTGGTARALREAGVAVTEVAATTGHPEMMQGRVKTLHPAIHAGLLARRDRSDDLEELEKQGYRPIDLVAVNLYPFRETIAAGPVTVGDAMEQIDIGGPTMIRAAAKNHRDVWVVVDPSDYDRVLEALDEVDGEGARTDGLRKELAAKVFRHISGYDEAVAGFLANGHAGGEVAPGEASLQLSTAAGRTLRYGENPDQGAAFYPIDGPEGAYGIAALEQLHGRALSYNNLLDLDGALVCLSPFAHTTKAAVCIIKHTTPCGMAVSERLADAYSAALRTDPVSAFGSVVATNRPIDQETAERLSELFVECVVAPGFEAAALERLSRKKNIRLLTFPELPEGEGVASFMAAAGSLAGSPVVRSIYGGLLGPRPAAPPFMGVDPEGWTVPTERSPTDAEMDDLRFAWAAVFGVKSNAILLAKDGATLGIGAGQMSRVDSSRLAVLKAADAGLSLDGAVLASDAFFPFRDGVDAAAEAGVCAIVQPGGSIRDEEVVGAADEHGIAMVLTGRRLFRH